MPKAQSDINDTNIAGKPAAVLPEVTGNELAIRLLVQALARVQGAMEAAKKDSKNPHYKSKYASLHASWLSCRKLLAENGFAVTQLPIMRDEGVVVLHTILYHEAGASIDCIYPVVYQACTAPQLGGALKYARRYSLETIIGITTEDDPEDDDGNTTPAVPEPKPAPKQQKAPSPPPQPTLKDQAVAYMAKIDAAQTPVEFSNAIEEARPLMERLKGVDNGGPWIQRIDEKLDAKRYDLEQKAAAMTAEQEPPTEEKGDEG